jgi:hypothetical protein
MNDNQKKEGRFAFAKDTKVTVTSLIVIVAQSLIIILGMVNRWDWIVWEFGAVLVLSGLIILYFGVAAIIKANRLMGEERKIADDYSEKN